MTFFSTIVWPVALSQTMNAARVTTKWQSIHRLRFAQSLLGNGQNAANIGAAGFNVTSGTRVTIRGGMSAYNGVNAAQGACGIKIIGKCSDLLIDGVRIFGNRHGVDFTAGDGASAVNARMRTTRITPATLLGPNKHTDSSQPNSEDFMSMGSITASRGLINPYLLPAMPASGVVVPNNFPFDVRSISPEESSLTLRLLPVARLPELPPLLARNPS